MPRDAQASCLDSTITGMALSVLAEVGRLLESLASTGEPGAIPAVGGAMDLAIGAKQTFVMMEHLTKRGESKLVHECSYPLTGLACVSRVYTDLAVIDVTREGLRAVELIDGLSFDELVRLSGVPILPPAHGAQR